MKTNPTSVSVIILTNHHQSTIAQALTSLATQTYPVQEWIIGDNGSSDDTWAVVEQTLEQLAKQHDAEVVCWRNARPVSPWEHFHQALERARGEWIVIQDGGCVSLPQRVAELVQVYEEHGRKQVLCHTNLLSADGTELTPFATERLSAKQALEAPWLHFAATCAFSRALYLRFGEVVRDVAEDAALGMRALLLGGYVYLPKPLVAVLPGRDIKILPSQRQVDKERLLQHAADALCLGRWDVITAIQHKLVAQGSVLAIDSPQEKDTRLAEETTYLARLESLEKRVKAIEQTLGLLPRPPSQIAVILHLAQGAQWEEFSLVFSNFSQPFDLYVSTGHEEYPQVMAQVKRDFPGAHVEAYPKRGRDMWPFLAIWSKIQARGYQLVVKLHTASLDHLPPQNRCHRELIWGLLGSPERIAQIIEAFTKNPSMGLFVPDGYCGLVSALDPIWPNIQALLAPFGANLEEGSNWIYPQGAMFWARPKALEHLLGLGFREQDFEEDSNQVDGTLAHVLERLIGGAVLASGLRVVSYLGDEDIFAFQRWLKRWRPSAEAGERRVKWLAERGYSPTFHLLLPLAAGEESALADTLDGLAAQIWPNWQLSIVSSLPCPDYFQNELVHLPHIRWHQVPVGQESKALCAIGRESTADWIGFALPGDVFEPHALLALAEASYAQGKCQLWYTDASYLGQQPSFKPDFNLDLLRAANYLGLIWVRKQALRELEIGENVSPSCLNYAVALSVYEKCGEGGFGHLPHVLYHRKYLPKEEKDERYLLQRHLERIGHSAQVEPGPIPGTRRLVYPLINPPKVSVIVFGPMRLALLSPCLESMLQHTSYADFEVLVAITEANQEVEGFLAELGARDSRVKKVSVKAEGVGAAVNEAAQVAEGEFLLLMDVRVVVCEPEWLGEMVRQGLRQEVGAVGARLVDANGRLKHAGLILGMGKVGIAGHWYSNQLSDTGGIEGRLQLVQNLSAVSDACLLIRKALYLEIGGMDLSYLCYRHVDLCLRLRERGLWIVWTPHATLQWRDAVERAQAPPAKMSQEVQKMWKNWGKRLGNDPAYNPNLSVLDLVPKLDRVAVVPWTRYQQNAPKVLGLPIDDWGIGEYRMQAPLRQLHQTGQAVCHTLPPHAGQLYPAVMSVAEVWRAQPDVIFGQELLTDTLYNVWEAYRLYTKAFLVYSQDDLVFALPAYHPMRQHFRDAKKKLSRLLKISDRVIVGTEPMAEALRKFGVDVSIVPNSLEWERWGKVTPKRTEHQRPRVGWAGAVQHLGDLIWLEPIIKATYQQVQWVFFGMCPEPLLPYVEYHKPVTFDAYPAKLASLDLDLAIAPLAHNAFNEAKSNLRLLEYGIMGWPVLASDIYPYRTNDPPIWRLPNIPRLWINKIQELVHEPEALLEAGAKLREWVIKHYILENRLSEWLAALTP